MESINKLRKWWRDRFPVMERQLGCEFREHVAAIESEVKASRVDAYTEGYDVGFASADDWAAQHEDAMAEHGWVRLPVDADGEVIHGGDMMVKPDSYDNRLFTVGGMTLYGDQWSVQGFAPTMLRHHAPTVEDVLREFAAEVETAGGVMELPDATFAEYTAKLRLAGDE